MKLQLRLNANHLKLIAVIAMTIDHVCDLIYPGFPAEPGAIALHIVGRSLAKWWTTNPTQKFGSEISKPAIIRCKLEIDNRQILNLLKPEDYIQFSYIFEKGLYTKYEHRQPYEIPKWQQLRCAYCDYLRKTYSLDMIIGNFNIPNQEYLPPKHGNEFDEFLLQYTEV